MNRWDEQFQRLCLEVASWSPCLSRKIGAILVRDKTVISTGFNGPPRGVSHCGEARMKTDKDLSQLIKGAGTLILGDVNMCPRQRLGFISGGALHLCPAIHAETNCITNAARTGVSTLGTTMYLTCPIPCKDCLGKIINAGISEIVCTSLDFYDKLSRWLVEESKIKIRTYEKEN